MMKTLQRISSLRENVVQIRMITSILNQQFQSLNPCYFNQAKEFSNSKPVKVVHNCSDKELKLVLEKSDEEVLNLPIDEVKARVSHLKKYKILPSMIHLNPWLLKCPIGTLSQKIKLIDKLGLNMDASIILMGKTNNELKKLVSKCKKDVKKHQQHRIKYLSEVLQTNEETICKAFIKYSFITTMSMSSFIKIIDILQKFNVSTENILSDFWVLQCNPKLVGPQMEKMTGIQVDNKRPWMGRCCQQKFDLWMLRIQTKQKLLHGTTVATYLARRLDYSEIEVQKRLHQSPKLQKMNVLKLKEMLDLLFKHGFTSEQILPSLSDVAKRRLSLIEHRILELKNHGYVPTSLFILGRSKKLYEAFVSRLERNRERDVVEKQG